MTQNRKEQLFWHKCKEGWQLCTNLRVVVYHQIGQSGFISRWKNILHKSLTSVSNRLGWRHMNPWFDDGFMIEIEWLNNISTQLMSIFHSFLVAQPIGKEDKTDKETREFSPIFIFLRFFNWSPSQNIDSSGARQVMPIVCLRPC